MEPQDIELLRVLNRHRSIRKYTKEKIAPELMNQLLETACRTSNTGNMQAYGIVVTTDDGLKKRLSPAHFNQPMVVEAAAVLTFCADFNRFTKWCRQRKADPGYDNLQSFLTSAIDALIAAQTFCIAAESQGLGICYLGTATYNAEAIIDILNLPELVVPITTVTVGYPEETSEQTDRLPPNAVVHREQYADFTPETIDELYREKEQSDFYAKFVTENNKETIAQVFTDVRYPRKNNELFSDKYLEVLKQQGFLK
ncbi:MAG: NADPH-dependent oxidoreductase [Prevotellaceae bacterium]|jgi:nitroreductase|nr:NADPH-dependent oxidoreductase [Prevotellaceae bacterium]